MSNYLNVDISGYFNNKIIADEKSVAWIKENIHGFGMYDVCGYFLSHFLPASNETVFIDNKPFIFPDKSQSKYDNMFCEEQTIILPNINCHAIHFLGTSEFGDNYEEYEVFFANGKSKKYTMIMPDSWNASVKWEYEKIDYNCEIKGTFSNLNKHWFYYHSTYFDMDQDDYVSRIILPSNPNIHILAITLEY